MMITESRWVSPLGYQSEGPFLVAAYQASDRRGPVLLVLAATRRLMVESLLRLAEPSPTARRASSSGRCTPAPGPVPGRRLCCTARDTSSRSEPVVHEDRSLQELWDRRAPVARRGPNFRPQPQTGVRRGTSRARPPSTRSRSWSAGSRSSTAADPHRTKVVDLAKYIHPRQEDGPQRDRRDDVELR